MRKSRGFSRTTLAITLIIMVTSLSACGSKGKEFYVPMTLTDLNTGEEIIADGSTEKDGRIIVEDASLYRGVISGLEHQDGATELALTQVTGTDFGAQELPVVIAGDTRLSFDRADLADGKYLEIYYRTGEPDQPIQALAANLLPDAAVSVWNGSVVEILQEDGYILSLLRLTDGKPVQFRCGKDTVFYKEQATIQVGDRLSIFTQGLADETDPLEGDALEVWAYAE